MAPYEALYRRKYRSPLYWNKVGERELTGPEIIQDASEKVALIRKRLKTTASRQKSYADPKRKNVEFQIVDYVFLKVSPTKGVMRFGKKEKLALRYSEFVSSSSSVPCFDAQEVHFRSFTYFAASECGSE